MKKFILLILVLFAAEVFAQVEVYTMFPDPTDKDKEVYYAVVVYNPSNFPVTLDQVYIDASAAATDVFSSITFSDPAGAVIVSPQNYLINWSGAFTVDAKSAREFKVFVDLNRKTIGERPVIGRVVLAGVTYSSVVRNIMFEDASAAEVGYVVAGGYPYFNLTFESGETRTFTTRVCERSNKKQILAGMELSITIPIIFNASISDQPGWRNETVIGNTVRSILSADLKGACADLQFDVTAPVALDYSMHIFDTRLLGSDFAGFSVETICEEVVIVAPAPIGTLNLISTLTDLNLTDSYSFDINSTVVCDSNEPNAVCGNVDLTARYGAAVADTAIPLSGPLQTLINPYACGFLLSGSSCNYIWTVTATESGSFYVDTYASSIYSAPNETADKLITAVPGSLNIISAVAEPDTIAENEIFWLNATVQCEAGLCFDVFATARYGAAAPSATIPNFGQPMWTNPNPIACTAMVNQSVCTSNFNINGTTAGNYLVDVLFTSADAAVFANSTPDFNIAITPGSVCILDVNQTNLDFGAIAPAAFSRNVLLRVTNTGTAAGNILINGTDWTGAGFFGVENTFFKSSLVDWTPLSIFQQLIYSSLSPNSFFDADFKAFVPAGQPAGGYAQDINIIIQC